MQTLFRLMLSQALPRVIQSAIGRWILTIVLLLFGAVGLLAAAGYSGSQAVTSLVIGTVFTVLGLAMLILTLRVRRLHTGVRGKVRELIATGKLLPIPPVPPLPKGVSEDDVAQVAQYARAMEALPWGENPTIPEWEARAVFDRTVARVRRVSGDWRTLREPIDTFVTMPAPLCHAGAAEVMFRLSYLRGRTYAPDGLRRGLSFAFAAQLHTTQQPDALIIQAKLLSGTASKYWLDLADKTIQMLREVAPHHPRLPDAQVLLHRQRGEYDAALACLNQILASPPSPEEEYVALSGKSLLLMDMKRYDEALKVFDEMLDRDSNDPWTWHNKSILLRDIGRYDEALECNERALSLMEFGAAHSVRETILVKRAQADGGATAV